jgi:hypothetical protein
VFFNTMRRTFSHVGIYVVPPSTSAYWRERSGRLRIGLLTRLFDGRRVTPTGDSKRQGSGFVVATSQLR